MSNVLTNIIEWVIFWFTTISVTIMFADTKNKQKPIISWQQYQNQPISTVVFEQWKREDKFHKDVTVILGKVHRGKHKNEYLVDMYCDNEKRVLEIRSNNIKTTTLQEFGKKTVVEHQIDEYRDENIYVYLIHPFTKKT